MSFYVRPKFKIGQEIFSIKKDKIVKIEVESICVFPSGEISYLYKNDLFRENQSFVSLVDATDFMESSYRIPFGKDDFCWQGNLTGVHRLDVKGGHFWFKKDKIQPYNSQIHAGSTLNSTSCFETQIEATKASLEMLEK